MDDRSKPHTATVIEPHTHMQRPEATRPEMAPIQHPHTVLRSPSRLASFSYAFAGISHLFRTQRNAQIHAAISIAVIVAGLFLQVERLEWLALVLTIMLVLAAEGVNTAIEAVVDLASPQRHPLAKIAKDVAAGTVLMTAIGAVLVGILVFLPRIWLMLIGWLTHQ